MRPTLSTLTGLSVLLLLGGCLHGGAARQPALPLPASPSPTTVDKPLPNPTAKIMIATTRLRRGESVPVRITGCLHGNSADFGLFLHDARELMTHPPDQSGLLHPSLTWQGADGAARLVIGKRARLGRALLIAVCTNNTPSRDMTIVP